MPLPCPLPLSSLEELAAQHGTPYQLYDEASIRGAARTLLDAFSTAFPPPPGGGSGGGFRQFFAVKALPNPAVLRLLLDEGCGLDCSSTAELAVAAMLGVPPSRVMCVARAIICSRAL